MNGMKKKALQFHISTKWRAKDCIFIRWSKKNILQTAKK